MWTLIEVGVVVCAQEEIILMFNFLLDVIFNL